jgi:hypothetical protein
MTNFPNVADADYCRPCETSKDELLVHGFEAIICLRATLNRILKHLYATEQAYCRPEQVGPIVAQISFELESWYYALPLNFQFSRDATAFKTSTCSLDPQLVGSPFPPPSPSVSTEKIQMVANTMKQCREKSQSDFTGV